MKEGGEKGRKKIASASFHHKSYNYLHSTRRKKSELRPNPTRFRAVHQYFPRRDFLTLCNTKDWLLIITPDDGSLKSAFPSKYQETSVTHGLALMMHSKYTSVPSRIELASILAPNSIFTSGMSG